MNLFNLLDFDEEKIMYFVKKALAFKKGENKVNYNGDKVIALLFFEPSTRTHYSFDVAAKRLGMQVVTFESENSALKKGETFRDTVKTFESFQVDGFVIRDRQKDYYKLLEDVKTPIINGGDGNGFHPTQSLLDLVTIYEHFGKFEGLKAVIVGDIAHSRVARTNYEIMKKLKMDVKLVADENLRSDYGEYVEVDDIIEDVDVFMLLRVQLERHDINYETGFYNAKYGLNKQRLEKLNKNAIIMHPAPFNLGVELTEDVLEDSRCKIFTQSENGVYLRMAVLNEYCK